MALGVSIERLIYFHILWKEPRGPINSLRTLGSTNPLLLEAHIEEWILAFHKRLPLLDTIITAAPLLGLLGTITGMMRAFDVLAQSGVNDPSAITGGVAEALIATATGLVIALGTLLSYNYLEAHIASITSRLEQTMRQILAETKK